MNDQTPNNSANDMPDEPPVDMMLGDTAPEHGTDFWDNVQGNLGGPVVVPITSADGPAQQAATASPADATQVNPAVTPNQAPDPTQVVPTVQPPVTPAPAAAPSRQAAAASSPPAGNVHPLRPDRSSRGPFLAAIAAALLVVVGAVGYFSLRDTNETDTANEAELNPTPAAVATPTALITATAQPSPQATAIPTAVPIPAPLQLAQSTDGEFTYWLQPELDFKGCNGAPVNTLMVSNRKNDPVAAEPTKTHMGQLSYRGTTESRAVFVDACNDVPTHVYVGTDPTRDGTFGNWYTVAFGDDIERVEEFVWFDSNLLRAEALVAWPNGQAAETIEMDINAGTYRILRTALPSDALSIGTSPDGTFEYFTVPSDELGCEGLENTQDMLVRNTETLEVAEAAIERFNTVTHVAHNGTHMAWATACEGFFQVYTSEVQDNGTLLRVWRMENPGASEGLTELNFVEGGAVHVNGEFFLGTSSYADTFVVNPDNAQVLETLYAISPALDGAVPFSELIPYNGDSNPLGTSADGRFRYYYAIHPSAPGGCEGEPADLYVVGNNDWAIPAYPSGVTSAPINIWLPGLPNQVALATTCEGFGATIVLGQLEPTGKMSMTGTFALPNGGYVTRMEWTDETYVVLDIWTESPDKGELHFNLDTVTGEITEIDI